MAIYHFLIDRRTLWGLILAGTLVGTLLFFAGLLVGLHQNLPDEPVQARSGGVQTASIPAAATSPASGSVAPSGSAPAVSSPSISAPSVSAPTAQVQASATSAPSATVSGPRVTRPSVRRPTVTRPTVTRPTVRRPTVTGGTSTRSATTTLTPPATGAGEAVAQPADGDAGGESAAAPAGSEPAEPEPREEEVAPPPPAPPPPTAFSIQVGAYRESRYLEAALEDLRTRGYSPYVVPITGSGGLVFRTIRIGRYRTREEAVRAAAEFHNRESMAALVREVTPEMRLSRLPDESPAAEPPSNVGL